ncbi:hypothetical protein [Sphingopyxis sp.]|uniref:hypothetical protein n=1 Tax=Sphingopyxis sp. TaxID=1908224 RepID=UPI002FC75CD6
MFGVSADLTSAKTRDGETRIAQYDQIEWKDRRHHRRRYRHRPAAAKRFIEEGAFVFIFGRRHVKLDDQ